MTNPVDHRKTESTCVNSVTEHRPAPRRFALRLRWWIAGLIFLITCINYIDRSSVGLLVTQFGPEIGITSHEYGMIGALLLLAYTLSQSVSGRLYDRFGARAGFAVSVVVWSAAAMAHSAIAGFTSFAACSFFLGLGEAGNWPGAAKVIAEWFPQKERALGMAIFNGGASMGGVIAPLFVARYLAPRVGWRMSFLIVGALGFVWLVAWLAVYRPLARHPHVSEEERRYIQEGPGAGHAVDAPIVTHSSFSAGDVEHPRCALSCRSGLVALYSLVANVFERGPPLQPEGHWNLGVGSLSRRGDWQPFRRMDCGADDDSRCQRECRTEVDDRNCRMSYDGWCVGSTCRERVCSTCVDFYRSIRLSNVDHQCPDTAQRFFLERCSRKRGRDGRDGRRHQQPCFQPLHCVAGFALWVWRCPDDRGHARSRWSSRAVLACWKNSTFGYRRIA